MVPGMPTDQGDANAIVPKQTTTSPSSVTLMSDERPSSPFSSLQETWEDIREAVTETDLYISTSKNLTTVSRAASSVWSFSKKVAWVVGTSTLVLVVPLLYEIDKELGPGYDPAVQTGAASSGTEPTAATSDSASTASMSTASTSTTPASADAPSAKTS